MNRLTPESCPGLTQEILTNLRKVRITSVLDFITEEDVQSLSEKTGLSLEELSTIKAKLVIENSPLAFRGDQLFDEMINSLKIIPTGCSNLDNLLGGGLYCKEVTELYGLPAVGKTQTCLSIACHTAIQLKQNTIYIDTSGSFSCLRIEEILQKKCEQQNKMEYVNSMARIQCIQAFDIYSALTALDEVKSSLSIRKEAFFQDIVLVVFDSVSSIISPILGGMQNQGHALMVSLSRMLKSLAMDYNLAILVTNNVVFDFTSNSYTKPALGKTWAHSPNNRVHLYHDDDQHKPKPQRLIKLTKSCRMPLGGVSTVLINEGGLM